MSENSSNGAGHWWAGYERESKRWLWRLFTASVLMLILGVVQFVLLFTGPSYGFVSAIFFLLTSVGLLSFWFWSHKNHRRVIREWNAETERRRLLYENEILTIFR